MLRGGASQRPLTSNQNQQGQQTSPCGSCSSEFCSCIWTRSGCRHARWGYSEVLIVGEIKRMYIWMVQRMGSAFGLPRLVMIGDWQRWDITCPHLDHSSLMRSLFWATYWSSCIGDLRVSTQLRMELGLVCSCVSWTLPRLLMLNWRIFSLLCGVWFCYLCSQETKSCQYMRVSDSKYSLLHPMTFPTTSRGYQHYPLM